MAHLGPLVESLPAGLLHQVGNQTNTHTDKPTQRHHGQTNTKTARTNQHKDTHTQQDIQRIRITQVAEGGENLSVGQRQLVCLTRCYFLSHQVLFFVLQGAIFFSPGALGIPNIPYSELQKKPLPCERTSRIFPPGPS